MTPPFVGPDGSGMMLFAYDISAWATPLGGWFYYGSPATARFTLYAIIANAGNRWALYFTNWTALGS